MNIKVNYDYDTGMYYAYDEDSYDGCIDGNNNYGCGNTEDEAIIDLQLSFVDEY